MADDRTLLAAAYCTGMNPRDGFIEPTSCLFKHDLTARTRQVHDFGPGSVPGEFVFVPKPAARSEDDGWLMGFVLDSSMAKTELVILDALRFQDRPRARITIPHRIPLGFHGNWIAAESSES